MKTRIMQNDNKNEQIFNKMDVEDSSHELSDNLAWTKQESIQTLWYFIIAFVMLLAFGYLVNRFLL